MNKGDLIRLSTYEEMKDEASYIGRLQQEYTDKHIEDSILNPEGVHRIRIQRDKIEYKDSQGQWNTIAGGSSPSFADVSHIDIIESDATVDIKWSDPNDVVIEGATFTKWAGTKLLRKEGSYPENENDGVLVTTNGVRDQYKNTPFKDTGLVNGKTYYYLLVPFSDDNQHTISEGNRFKATPTEKDDLTGSPGNGKLVKGTMEEGYFGVVPASQLITGSALSDRVNVTQGTSQFSDTPWHKFAYKGKVLFVAQKTIRHSISWDHLSDKKVVYGDTVITIDGVKYKVRLIKGALTDPSDYNASDRGAKGSEWNRLVCPLSVQRKDNSWDYKEYMENDLQDWGTYLSDSDLVVRDLNGRYTWCQEVRGGNSSYRVDRGSLGVSYSGTRSSSNTYSCYGWRPVLEVV